MVQTTQQVCHGKPGDVCDRYLGIAEAHQATLQRQAAAYRLAREASRTSGCGLGARVAALLAALGAASSAATRSNSCAPADIAED
jgi:hypothetical protein